MKNLNWPLSLFLCLTGLFSPPMAFTPRVYAMASRVNPDTGSFLTIGSGYDLVTGNPAATCIVPQKITAVSGGLAEISANFTYIKDYESLASALEISSSTNVKIGMQAFTFKLDAITKFFKEQKMDDESLYFLYQVIVKSPIEKINVVKLNEDFKKLLEGEGGAQTFRDACGDEFVDANQKGGAFYSLVKISTHTSAEKKELELLLNRQTSNNSLTGNSLRQKLLQVTKEHHYELFSVQVGKIVEKLPTSLEDFEDVFKQVQKFAQDLPNHNTGAIIMASTASYKQAMNYPHEVSLIRVSDKINIVEKYGQLKFSILKVLNRLESVMKAQEKFEPMPDKMFEDLTATRDQYLKNLEILTEFAGNCFYDIKDCKIPTSIDGFIFPSYSQFKSSI